MTQKMIQRMAVGNGATPFGCCNYFDACADEIIGLTYGGNLGLLDWLGFQPTDVCYRSVEFITYLRPEQITGADAPGYLGDPCDAPYGFEFGTRKITVEDFGRIAAAGPTRDIAKQHIKYCKTRPIMRLDGTPVTNENEWDLLMATETLLLHMNRYVITGNATTPGQFDGLRRWVSTNHGGSLNSYVVQWNGNPLAGGAGITLNGNPLAATVNFIEVLTGILQEIKTRIRWNPMLAQRQRQSVAGDMILLVPTAFANCLLNYYTCWSVCPGQQYNEMTLNTYEARTFRDNLMRADNPLNVYGNGYITLDGTVIPLLTHDYELQTSPTLSEVYFLTGSLGPMRIFEGEMLSAESILNNARWMLPTGSAGGDYFALDGGRLLGKKDFENNCAITKLWHYPRLFNMAPWMSARFQNVQCAGPIGAISADPAATSFYPETSFDPALCP
jgi:hypothetical protein